MDNPPDQEILDFVNGKKKDGSRKEVVGESIIECPKCKTEIALLLETKDSLVFITVEENKD